MKLRLLLVLISSISVSYGLSIHTTQDESKKPNIVLMLTDDQDIVTNSLDYMPVLKRVLIERGTKFNNAFVHTPVCCPSRMSILSGKYLHNLYQGKRMNNSISGGCDHPDFWRADSEKKTYATYAKAEGYVTSFAGKYLSPKNDGAADVDPLQGIPGCESCFHVPPGYDKWLVQRENAKYYNYKIIRSDDGGNTAWQERHGSDYHKDYFPDLAVNRTLDMIEEFTSVEDNKMKKPFLAVISWPSVHEPFTPALWASDMFEGIKVPRYPNYNASSEFQEQKHWLVRQINEISAGRDRLIDQVYQNRTQGLQSVDKHVGLIVDLIERKGELDNTYFIYTSDNGFNLGNHRLGDKRHLYEADLRVPFVVAGPGIPQNVTTDRVVLNVDIAPSIYQLVTGNTKPPPGMDGVSFIPYLRSLQQAVDNNQDVTLASAIEDPYHREDFLISYYGEANPECGVLTTNCDAPQEFVGDSFNNTYHCVRTLTHGINQPSSVASLVKKDSIYCMFDDDEDFVEYYDHLKDPWQLQNRANELSDYEHDQFKARISMLRSCQGAQCRQPPSRLKRSESLTKISYESSCSTRYAQYSVMMVIVALVFATVLD